MQEGRSSASVNDSPQANGVVGGVVQGGALGAPASPVAGAVAIVVLHAMVPASDPTARTAHVHARIVEEGPTREVYPTVPQLRPNMAEFSASGRTYGRPHAGAASAIPASGA